MVRHRDGIRCRIIVELNAAGLPGKEVGLDALGLERLNRASDLRRRLLEHHFGRKLLRARRGVRISLVRLEQTLPELQRPIEQALEQQRIERAALAVYDHPQGGLVVIRGLVAAHACQRVVHIGNRNDLRRNRDRLAGQTVRIAAAVIALVVPARDLIRGLEQRLLIRERQAVQDIRADRRVRLHDLEFFLCQLAGLVDDLIRNADLADIVQRGRIGDQLNILLRQRIAVGLLHQTVQQNLGDDADVQHMRAALAVAELDNMAEYIDHQVADLFFFVNLLGGKPHQPLLLGGQYQRVDHAAADDHAVERAADIVGNAEVVRVLDVLNAVLRRDHHHRDILNLAVVVHRGQHIKAVHLRHDHIQQDKVYIGVRPQQLDRAGAVLRLDKIVFVTKYIG